MVQPLSSRAREPVLAAWGAGVDSTAMLIEMVERGEPVDHVLFADTGAERPATTAFVPLFRAWLQVRGVASTVVRYHPKRFKNWPAYRTLTENLITNGTLPSVTFGRGSCSIKWKQAPQNAWAATWAPALEAWAAGRKVVKLIGFDCSRRDLQRYAEAERTPSDLYRYRYPLQEWGWVREDCEARIEAAGLAPVAKSACFFCIAMRPAEVRALPAAQLRQIVLIEARAKPRLRTVDGLWRKPVQGLRKGGEARPGSMSEFIRSEGLLPAAEVDAIAELAPQSLERWQDAVARSTGPTDHWPAASGSRPSGPRPSDARPEAARWLTLFDAFASEPWRIDQAPGLYDGLQGGPS